MFDAGAAKGRLILDDSDYKKGAQRVEGTNKGMIKNFIGAQLAVQALNKAFNFIKNNFASTIKASSDLAEETAKFGTVYSDVQKRAKKATDNLSKSYGLSTVQAIRMQAATGDLLTGFGFAQEKALDMSTATQRLAVDLASFTNLAGGAEAASNALTKMMLGETESVKSLGIVIRQTDIDARIAAEGKKHLTGKALMQAKAEVALAMAYEQSKNAIGDFERTNKSFANTQRQISASTQDLQATLGNLLLPTLTKLGHVTLSAIRATNDWLSQNTKLEKSAGRLQTATSALLSFYSEYEQVTKKLANEKGRLSDMELLELQTRQSLLRFDITGQLIKLGDAYSKLYNQQGELHSSQQREKDRLEEIKKRYKSLAESVLEAEKNQERFVTVSREVRRALGTPLELFSFEAARKHLKNWSAEIAETEKSFGQATQNIEENALILGKAVRDGMLTMTDLAMLPESLRGRVLSVVEDLKNGVYDAVESVSGALNKNKADLSGWAQSLNQGFQNAGQKTAAHAEAMANALNQSFQNAGQKASEHAKKTFTEVSNMAISIASEVKGLLSQIMSDVAAVAENELAVMRDKHSQELDAIREQLQTKRDIEIEENEITFEAKFEQLEAQREAGLINQAEYDMRRTELEAAKAKATRRIDDNLKNNLTDAEKKRLDKENAMKKKAFEANKRNQIAETWIQFAIGSIAAWTGAIQALGSVSIVGPALAIAMAAVMQGVLLGSAISSTVRISQQQFIPEKRLGGSAEGLTRINETGRGEIVNLPGGSTVIPADLSRQITSASGKMNTFNISFAGANIVDDMSLDKIATKLIRIMGRELRLS